MIVMIVVVMIATCGKTSHVAIAVVIIVLHSRSAGQLIYIILFYAQSVNKYNYLMPNLSKNSYFAVTPLVLTPFVRC